MDATTLILTWSLSLAAWFPTSKKLVPWLVFRMLYFCLGAAIGFGLISSMVPLANHWLWLICVKGFLVILESAAIHSLYSSDFDSTSEALSWVCGILGAIILVVALVSGAYFGHNSDIRNAYYFDSLLTKMPEQAIPFNITMPDKYVRLTTSELAESIAKGKMGVFGSDVKIASSHITMYEKRLVWICAIAPQNMSKILGLVIVDANDPESRVTVLDKVSFVLGENLNYDPWRGGGSNIAGHAWFSSDMSPSYGRAYITQDYIGKWYCVLTTYYIEPWTFISKYRGVEIYDQEGNFFGHYNPENTPEWVAQPYDEDSWLEGHIKNWGTYRTETGFDKNAAQYSSVRVEMSEDTRYIYDTEIGDVVAVVLVNPIGQKDTLAGMFKATRKGIYYYDLREFNLISGNKAIESVNSELSAKLQIGYFATMPLLYYIDGKPVWYVPIYWKAEETINKETKTVSIQLKGLGLVDATNRANVKITYLEPGMSGEQLVRKARLAFLGKIVEKDINQRKQDIIKFFESNGITIREPEVINPDIMFYQGTCNYTSSEEWESTQEFLSNFIAMHSSQTEVLVKTEIPTIKIGFWIYNEDKSRSEFYYVSVNLQIP